MILKKGSRGKEVKELQALLHLYQDGIFGPIVEEAVIKFQKEHNLIPDGIVGDKTWAELKKTAIIKSNRYINKIIIHCSATVEGKDYTVADIKKWHLAKGYSDVGYHYIIYRDGSVNIGRNVNIIGAHCQGYNSNSIGICYIGGLDKNGKSKDTRTEQQKKSLVELLKKLKSLYPNATIHGHNEFAKKDCPCFNVKQEYTKL